jgi:hypothetical protein
MEASVVASIAAHITPRLLAIAMNSMEKTRSGVSE